MNDSNRGGLRSPAGGRPKKALADKKVKINVTLSQGIMEWIEAQRGENEPLSNAIERLLNERRATS